MSEGVRKFYQVATQRELKVLHDNVTMDDMINIKNIIFIMDDNADKIRAYDRKTNLFVIGKCRYHLRELFDNTHNFLSENLIEHELVRSSMKIRIP